MPQTNDLTSLGLLIPVLICAFGCSDQKSMSTVTPDPHSQTEYTPTTPSPSDQQDQSKLGAPFGSECSRPADCESLICLASLEDSLGICTINCGEETPCPEGTTCQTYAGFGSVCIYSSTGCGNGEIEDTEECDDGNTQTELCDYGDEECEICNSQCELVSGQAKFCGDGEVNGGEACDGEPNCNDECEIVTVPCESAPMGCPNLEFIEIEGEEFTMGSDSLLADTPIMSEKIRPAHRVNVSSFAIMKAPVTVEQYRQCVDAGACTPPQRASFPWNDVWYLDYEVYMNWGVDTSTYNLDQHPIKNLNWQQVQDFAHWVGARLPSEAEWEFAAGSRGQDYYYPWGNEAPTCDRTPLCYQAYTDGRQYTNCRYRLPQGTHPFGDFLHNNGNIPTDSTHRVCLNPEGNTEQGLCDMIGLGLEWVQDQWHDNYEGAPNDGSAWCDGDCASLAIPDEDNLRVLRGVDYLSKIIKLHEEGKIHGYHIRMGVRASFLFAQFRLVRVP